MDFKLRFFIPQLLPLIKQHVYSRSNMSRTIDKGPSSEIIFLIDQKILCEQWSPEQISNWLKISNYEPVSHTWIYQHI